MTRLSNFALAALALCFAEAWAEGIKVAQPVVYPAEIAAWLDSSKDISQQAVECRQIRPLKKTWACFFKKGAKDMNASLSRASLFVEGNYGHQPGGVPAMDSGALRSYNQIAGGHNRKFEDLIAFFNSVQSNCKPKQKLRTKSDAVALLSADFKEQANCSLDSEAANKLMSLKARGTCLQPEEKMFFDEFLLPQIQNDPQGYVIAFTSKESETVLRHEFQHAWYYEDTSLRQAVRSFWTDQMTNDERGAVENSLRVLGRSDIPFDDCGKIQSLDIVQSDAPKDPRHFSTYGLYFSSPEEIIIDEFQAFSIAHQESFLSGLGAKSAVRLREFLTQSGFTIENLHLGIR